MRFLSRIVCGTIASLTLGVAPAAETGKQWVYVGTYTNAKNGSKGIYRYDFDPATGQLTPAGLAAEVVNPSFLTIHPSGKYLFAISEVGGKDFNIDGVKSFRIDPKSGKLSLIAKAMSSGSAPCHISVDKAGKNVLIANYASGTIGVLQVLADGKFGAVMGAEDQGNKGPDPKRQEGPHAHCVTLDPANRFFLVADLGLDEVEAYRLPATPGFIIANKPPAYHTAPGAGPRHIEFHPDGKRAYLINELNCTLSALDYDAEHGVLKERQTVSTLPGERKANYTCAEVVVHPSGRFVYGSNRGHDSIAAFAIEPDGKLKLVGHQGEGIKTPRSFNIDPSGKWMIVANQDGNSLVVFKIDQQTGALSPTGVRAEVGGPVCVKFWPAK